MDRIAKIREIMSQKVDLSNVTEDTELSSLGLDSLDLVEVVMEIEEALDIKFEMDEIASFKTLKDLVDCVNSK